MVTTAAVLNRLFPVGKICINEVLDQNDSIRNLPHGFEPSDCEVLFRSETRAFPYRRTFYLVRTGDTLVYFCVYEVKGAAPGAMVFGAANQGTAAGNELTANLMCAIPRGALQ